jgi:hypothetical protein
LALTTELHTVRKSRSMIPPEESPIEDNTQNV